MIAIYMHACHVKLASQILTQSFSFFVVLAIYL